MPARRYKRITDSNNGSSSGQQVFEPFEIKCLVDAKEAAAAAAPRHQRRRIHKFVYDAFDRTEYDPLRGVAELQKPPELHSIKRCHHLSYTHVHGGTRAEARVSMRGLSDFKRPDTCSEADFAKWCAFGLASDYGGPVKTCSCDGHLPLAERAAAAVHVEGAEPAAQAVEEDMDNFSDRSSDSCSDDEHPSRVEQDEATDGEKEGELMRRQAEMLKVRRSAIDLRPVMWLPLRFYESGHRHGKLCS